MKKLIRFGSIGLVIAGAIAFYVGEAGAQTFPDIPAISTKVDATGPGMTIQVYGTPRTQVPVTISGAGTSTTKSFRANGCGHVVINNAADYSSLSVNGNAIGVNSALSKTAIAPPTCLGTTSSTLPPSHDTTAAMSSVWNLGDGAVLVTVGVQANAPNGRMVDISYADNSEKSRFISLDDCGLGKFKVATNSASVSVNGSTAAAANTLPSNSGLRCFQKQTVLGASDEFSFVDPIPTVFKDYNNTIYIKTNPSAVAEVGLASVPANRSVTSDRCGGLTIGSQFKPQTTPITIDGQTIGPSSLPIGLKPNCKATGGVYAYDVAPTENIRTSAGQVFIKSTTANPSGFGDRRIVQISTSAGATRNITANVCGVATIKGTTANPITPATEFTYTGSSYTVSGLPIKELSCVNLGTASSPNFKLFRAMN